MDHHELVTEGGYRLDEAISALQKEIRRGNEKEAVFWAIEVNTRFPDYLWKRLVVIVCEDIGAANHQLVGIIVSLSDRVIALRKDSKRKSYDIAILGYAILSMARSPKSRESDDVVNHLLREMRLGIFNPAVSDYALDKHTQRGRQMGRTVLDFWDPEGGCKINHEAYPSQYLGWDPLQGDAEHDQHGKRVYLLTIPTPAGFGSIGYTKNIISRIAGYNKGIMQLEKYPI